MVYFDKNGKQIKKGDTIRHDSGELEKVFACGDDNLGVRANDYECYPLSEFDMREWEVVE